MTGQQEAQEHGEDYRDACRVLTRIVRIEILVIFLLTCGLVLFINNVKTEDSYYALAFDDRRMALSGLDEPGVNIGAMLSWASQAATQVMTFGFNDLNQKLGESRVYFTDVGWESFRLALVSSQLLRNIKDKKQIMTAAPLDVPVVEYKGLRNGDYVWDIRVPILLTVRAGSTSRTARPTLYVTVVRVPTQLNPAGLGIQRWLLL